MHIGRLLLIFLGCTVLLAGAIMVEAFVLRGIEKTARLHRPKSTKVS